MRAALINSRQSQIIAHRSMKSSRIAWRWAMGEAVKHRVFFQALISMAIFLLAMPSLFSSTTAVDKLENAYRSRLIKDPIEAIIFFLERARTESISGWQSVGFMILTLGIPWLIFIGLGKLFNLVAPAYNFYWGDYMGFYDKRRVAQNIFWTVIVLGILVYLSDSIFRLFISDNLKVFSE